VRLIRQDNEQDGPLRCVRQNTGIPAGKGPRVHHQCALTLQFGRQGHAAAFANRIVSDEWLV
jgi:hypothetical protein